MTQSVFDRLRALVLASMGELGSAIANQRDVVPIKHTQDAWICLLRDGHVAHLDINGANIEFVQARDRATALVGRLAVRFPLATWFVPRADHACTL